MKHFLFGRPLPSERLEHERLNKKTTLAVLPSDAISSVAGGVMRCAMLALAIAACGGGSPETRFALATRPAQNLVGTWDAKLSLNRPYQLELHDPAAKGICGTVGFLENHYARGGSGPTDTSPHLGVYDLDLSLLGLNWLGDNPFPTAVATSADDYRAPAGVVSDSVAIVLNPGSQERIVLLGRYHVDGISGRWTAQSSRGTASGSFTLTPHVNARDQSPSCSEFH